ncbi:MAG: hypothetical protein GC156_14930 [Actinomycetales bacterium]|nr:hypothetical protein [Actinomycetales bacterium]
MARDARAPRESRSDPARTALLVVSMVAMVGIGIWLFVAQGVTVITVAYAVFAVIAIVGLGRRIWSRSPAG